MEGVLPTQLIYFLNEVVIYSRIVSVYISIITDLFKKEVSSAKAISLKKTKLSFLLDKKMVYIKLSYLYVCKPGK